MLAPSGPPEQRFRVYLAGGLAISAPDGRVVDERAFAGRQGRRLFVRLATAHRALPAEDLADDLWGAAWPDGWSVALRSIISKLRAAMRAAGAPDAIVARDGTYELRLPADAWLDVDAASQAIHAAEHALAEGDADAATGWALAARAVSSRPLLPGEASDWLDDLRWRLDDVRLRALATLGEIWLRHGNPAMAARDAAEAIAMDPFREAAHRLLIRAHLAAGEHAAALQAYRSCLATFQRELGVLPSPETVALVQPLLGDRGQEVTRASG
jgi:DNA-binding SARP family transcriptional activator